MVQGGRQRWWDLSFGIGGKGCTSMQRNVLPSRGLRALDLGLLKGIPPLFAVGRARLRGGNTEICEECVLVQFE